MRYTTVIDISEIPRVYKSVSTRILYFHLAIKAGYHEDDRDLISISIRRMASDSGLTVSAVRHALGVLESAGLLKRVPHGYLVTKWLMPEKVPARPKSSPAQADARTSELLRKADAELEAYRRKVETVVRQCTVEELKEWAQELDQGRSLRHHGVQINANKKNVEWLNQVISRR